MSLKKQTDLLEMSTKAFDILIPHRMHWCSVASTQICSSQAALVCLLGDNCSTTRRQIKDQNSFLQEVETVMFAGERGLGNPILLHYSSINQYLLANAIGFPCEAGE